MSDYLSNIAAKALNLMPAIEPRPISLFEPPADLGSSFDRLSVDRGVDAALDPAALPSDTAAEPRPPQGQRVARPLAYDRGRPADTTPPVAEPTVSTRRMPGLSPLPQGIAPAAGATAPEPPATGVTSGVAPDLALVAMGPAGLTLGPLGQDRQTSLTAQPSMLTVGGARLDVPFEPLLSSTPSAPTSPRVGVPAVPALSLDTEARRMGLTPPTAGKIVVQALVTPAGESSAGDPTMAQAPQPTIRVSIGRVEVRAVMPPAPAAPHPKAARPNVKLSLADYLKSSQGGR